MDGGFFYDGVDGTIYDIPWFPCIYTLFGFILLDEDKYTLFEFIPLDEDKMFMSSFVVLTSDVYMANTRLHHR